LGISASAAGAAGAGVADAILIILKKLFTIYRTSNKMDKLNRVFENMFGMTYNDWHKTEFYTAEKKYAKAQRLYQHDPEKQKKWKKAEARYKRAMFILETYERFESEFS